MTETNTDTRCDGGCSFWNCGREMNHPGPCQPAATVPTPEEQQAIANRSRFDPKAGAR